MGTVLWRVDALENSELKILGQLRKLVLLVRGGGGELFRNALLLRVHPAWLRTWRHTSTSSLLSAWHG